MFILSYLIKIFITLQRLLTSFIYPVYADKDLKSDLPNTITSDLSPGFTDAVQNLMDFCNAILNVLIGLGVASCIGAAIFLAVEFAVIDDPKERAKLKKNFVVLFITTAGLGGIRLITALILALLNIF